MFNSSGRRRSAHSGPRSPNPDIHARIDKAAAPPNVGAPDAPGRFTLDSRRKARPLQFEGEILAGAHTSGIAAHYRVAVYGTRNGKFVAGRWLNSFRYLPGRDPTTESAVAVFDNLPAACAWFAPGSLTSRLLGQIRDRGLQESA
jgi:hypothetical protein